MRQRAVNTRQIGKAWLGILGLGAAAWFGSAGATVTQGQLIESLSKRGMHDLLERMMEKNPPADAAERQLFAVAQARLRSDDADRRLRESAEAGEADRIAEFTQAAEEAFVQFLDEQRFLADDLALADRRERAIWKTDLAESLLFVWLRGRENYAAEFLEFGAPTNEQRLALYVGAEEALRELVAAEQLVNEARDFYGRNADARAEDQGNQLYFRLLEDYGQQRIPFYAAAAMHTVALLPDEAPYFANLGRGDRLPGQRDSIAQERTRLLREGADRLEALLTSDPGGVETQVRSRLGRIQTALGGAADALDEQLEPAIRAGSDGLSGLSPVLGKASAFVEMERYPQALEALDDALRVSAVQEDTMLRLLLTDARFAALKARAKSEAQRNAAYEVYNELLEDPALADRAAGMRILIYQRWADELEVGQDVADLPPTVRMAVGHIAREAGQRAMFVDGDTAEAERMLSWSLAANQSLRDPALPDAVRASGLFNFGLAKVLLDQTDVATLVEAIEAWTEVADRYPQQPVAAEAAQYAADYATVLVQQAPDHPQSNSLYDEAMRVLFTRYDESEAATKHRLFYAFRVFQESGQHERAALEYARVPFGHPQYFEAQRLRLFNLQEVYEQTPVDQVDSNSGRPLREAKRRIASGAADQLAGDARRAMEQAGTSEQELPAGNAYGSAMVTLAGAAADAGQVEEALGYLDEALQTFADATLYDEARRDVLNRRILVLVEAVRYEDAADAARDMMSDFPDAAAAVVSGTLTTLESQINDLRGRASDARGQAADDLEEQAGTLAAVASRLAKLLLDWADTQGFEPATMLAYELPYAKALRVAGRPDEALRLLENRGILEGFADDLGVLEATGETYFAVGVESQRVGAGIRYALADERAALAAIPHFDRIITGLQPPYPDAYWNAWLKRLALNVALGQDADKVPLRIRQLQAAHPDLGGPAFAERFERLSVQARGVN
ncbi:MAG: hypothetical protein AAF663_02845 [Planctomycetota bacterium]